MRRAAARGYPTGVNGRVVTWRGLLLGWLVMLPTSGAGCASHDSVLLRIVDAQSDTPVSAARVTAGSMSLYNPAYPHQYLNPLADEADRTMAITDARGMAEITLDRNRASMLRIAAPGYMMWEGWAEYRHRRWRLERLEAPDGWELPAVRVEIE